MNKYGSIAQAHWRKHRPVEYGQLPDPDNFFSILGDEIEQRVDSLSEAIVGTDPPNETFQQKMGRWTEARQTAESEVLQEMLNAERPDQNSN